MSSDIAAIARRGLTANFHLIKSCNFRCRYCYATFADVQASDVLRVSQVVEITRALARHFTKVTFAGGEPTLFPQLPQLLAVAKGEGALTNVVTNGSTIDDRWLRDQAGTIDFLTLSVDSSDAETQRALGRAFQDGTALTGEHYVALANTARRHGIRVKVNTVVTAVTSGEDLSHLVTALAPSRWKILQATPVIGQNDRFIDQLSPSRAEFDRFVARHVAALAGSDIRIVAEPTDLIRGSYVMVDPAGRFFDSTYGMHRYSPPILDVGLEAAFAHLGFDSTKFLARGGDADWRGGSLTANPSVSTFLTGHGTQIDPDDKQRRELVQQPALEHRQKELPLAQFVLPVAPSGEGLRKARSS